MKKIIYLLLFAFTTMTTISACTEEEITPKSELGGKPQDPTRSK